MLGRRRRGTTRTNDHLYWQLDQLGGQFGHAFAVPVSKAPLDCQVFALCPAQLV